MTPTHSRESDRAPGPDDLKRLARSAKGAAAAIGAVADAWRDLSIELAAMRARLRLGEDAPPPSWDVEREAFLRRLFGGDSTP